MTKPKFELHQVVRLRGCDATGVIQTRMMDLDTNEFLYTVRSDFNGHGPMVSEAAIADIDEENERVRQAIKARREKEDAEDEARWKERDLRRKAIREADSEAQSRELNLPAVG